MTTPWDGDCPETWERFEWPAWVPSALRRQVEDAWPQGPREWLDDWPQAYRFGALGALSEADGTVVTGRYVHRKGSSGFVVTSDFFVKGWWGDPPSRDERGAA